LDKTLLAMREFYGEEKIGSMDASEFYKNYKKFT
jgi:hypothetical protein